MRTFVILCKADVERMMEGKPSIVIGPFKGKRAAEFMLSTNKCPSEHFIVEAIHFRRMSV